MTCQEMDEAIEEVAGGNLEALKEVYIELKQQVFETARKTSRNFHLAEDVVQDTFVKVYDKASSYDPRGKSRQWVMGIACNLTKQKLQKEHKYYLVGDNYETFSPGTSSVEEETERHQLAETLLSILTPKERDVVTLHLLCENKLTDIADLLHLPLGSVYWYYSNARRKMLRYLRSQEDASDLFPAL